MGISRIWVVLATSFWVVAASAGPMLTYHGRLLKPDSTPVTASAVEFRVRIYSPGAERCLFYDEEYTLDLSGSEGVFSLEIGGMTPSSTNTEPFTLAGLFRNSGTFTFGGTKCASGSTYAPAAADGRVLALSFNDGSLPDWEDLPDQKIGQVPQAMESMSVGGFGPGDLFRVVDGSGSAVALPAWTPADYAKLLDLVNGTSAQYATASSGYMTHQPNGVACATGQVLKWSAASRWECAADDDTTAAATLPPLADGRLWVGDGSSAATARVPGGDVSMTNAGVFTIAGDAVNSAKIQDGSVGVADLDFAAVMPVNTGLVVRNGAQLSNQACSLDQILKWTATGWACTGAVLAETDPKVGANTTNALSKWDGAALVASAVTESSGNVGIGTASPAAKLSVGSSSQFQVDGSGNVTTGGSVQGRGVFSQGDDNSVYAVSGAGTWPNGGSTLESTVTLFNTSSLDGTGSYSLYAVKNTAGLSQRAYIGAVSSAGGGTSTPTLVFGQQTGSNTYAERMRIDPGGNVGIGTGSTAPSAKLEVQGQAVSRQATVPTGNAVDFDGGNLQVLRDVGSSTIALSHLVAGGSYTVVVEDLASRTYSFTGCTTSYFTPANGPTESRSVYTILAVDDGASGITCYVSWITGFN